MKKTLTFALIVGATLPYPAAAQSDLQGFITDAGLFINASVIPLLFAVAFLFFVVNVARYFVIGSASTEGREKARRYALWSLAGFVFLVTLWGTVNLLVRGLDFDRETALCPDYLTEQGADCNSL